MQIILTKPDLVRFIENEVNSGRFGSAQQVVEEAVYRLLEQAFVDETDPAFVASLIDANDACEAGKGKSLEQFAREMGVKPPGSNGG